MILLDSHVAIWLALEPVRLSPAARSAIERARARGQALTLSAITLLEIATAARLRRLELSAPIYEFLLQLESRFSVLPLSARICAQSASLPPSIPKDPGDRVIVATALVHSLELVTSDKLIRAAGVVRTIW